MALEAGTRLGHYEVLSSLGAGGMGEVYRAKDTKLGREVAIKLLLEDVSQDAERLARFEREARVLASLNHSNIASLHAFERDGDTNFLVMEVVDGETLAERIKRGAIRVDDALPLFLQIAEGLEAAHENGVIHRDLKPANIKVTDDGQRSRFSTSGWPRRWPPIPASRTPVSMSMSPTLTLAATQRGEILGTAAYMAPEQARGLDRRQARRCVGLRGVPVRGAERQASFPGRGRLHHLGVGAQVRPGLGTAPRRCTPRKAPRALTAVSQQGPDDSGCTISVTPASKSKRPLRHRRTMGRCLEAWSLAEKRSPVPLTLAALVVGAVIAGYRSLDAEACSHAPPERSGGSLCAERRSQRAGEC